VLNKSPLDAELLLKAFVEQGQGAVSADYTREVVDTSALVVAAVMGVEEKRRGDLLREVVVFLGNTSTTNNSKPPRTKIIDGETISKLVQMGYNENGARKAVVNDGGGNFTNALEYCVQHCDDEDFAVPTLTGGEGGGGGAGGGGGGGGG